MMIKATVSEKEDSSLDSRGLTNMHSLGEREIFEREWLLQVLAQNSDRDLLFISSMGNELSSFFRFFGTILPSFGAAMVKRKIIRKNKNLNQILQFEELKQVRNNIEKGSFAYDTLLFNLTPFQIMKNESHLANLVCLAILFGDEFIDGIAQSYGKEKIQGILNDRFINFSLQKKVTDNQVELYYQFDIRTVLPNAVLESINQKYGISYHAFYEHLIFLLSELNLHLNKLDRGRSIRVAELICAVCNKCFDTYQIDVVRFELDYSLLELLEYQDKKDDDIIQSLLTLRSVLLHKKTSFYQPLFASWSTMVRTMQVYDDMQDIAVDFNYQMNFLAYFAKNYFKTEWNWLQSNQQIIHCSDDHTKHMLLCIQMPASVIMCIQYARNLVQNSMNWEQKKITTYLWNKNWFLRERKDQNKEGLDRIIFGDTKMLVKDKILILQERLLSIKDPLLNEQLIYAHIADIVLFDEALSQSFYASVGWKDAYFMKQSFFDFPVYKKASLIKKWILEQKGIN